MEFEAIAEINDRIAVGVLFNSNGLFEINLLTGKCTYIMMVQGELIDQRRLYTSACLVEDKVYFIPYAAKEIAVYDLNKKEIKKVKYNKLDSQPGNYKRKCNFSCHVRYGQYIYMIPCTYPAIVRINTEDDSIEYFDSWNNNIEYMFRKGVMVEEDDFYIPSVINNVVLRFNMKECKAYIYNVGEENKGHWSIIKHKEWFYLTPMLSESVTKWNYINGEINKLNDLPQDFKGGDFCFSQIYYCNNKMYLIPARANMGIEIKCENEEVKRWNMEELSDTEEVRCMCNMGKRIFLSIKKNGNIHHVFINTENNEVTNVDLYFDESKKKYEKDYFKLINKKHNIIKESEMYDIENYIESVCYL